jgi:hypothetical protein
MGIQPDGKNDQHILMERRFLKIHEIGIEMYILVISLKENDV